jgi:crotonobetainyl-CoA:carnitine CoA-transferase CaiB-like acyl-CoA transferase
MTDDSAELPLGDVTVLDLSTYAVGPFATQVMAALGATVLKVERGPTGDPERTGEYAMFLAVNRGKHSIVLDLKDPDDIELVRGLLPGATVMVEGFRPGVAETMGLGFDTVRRLNPSIIYVSLPGWGSTGPYSGEPAYDIQFRSIAGDAFLNRDESGRPRPHSGAPVFDYAAAMYAVIGILAELRREPREAVHIEVPIVAAGLAWDFGRLIDPAHADAEVTKLEYALEGSDGKWICMNSITDQQFCAMCEVIGRPDLPERDDLASFPQRRSHAPELNEIVRAAVGREPAQVWIERFQGAGVPCVPILAGSEVFDDPQVRHLDVIRMEPSPHARLPIFGVPQRTLVDPVTLGADGDAVRERGWSALAPPRPEAMADKSRSGAVEY